MKKLVTLSDFRALLTLIFVIGLFLDLFLNNNVNSTVENVTLIIVGYYFGNVTTREFPMDAEQLQKLFQNNFKQDSE